MKVEFPCRFRKSDSELSDEDKAAIEAHKIIHGDSSLPILDNEDIYTYVGIVLDLKDIRGFNAVDADHTCIRTYQIDSYVVKLPYELFMQFYQEQTGDIIKRATVTKIK